MRPVVSCGRTVPKTAQNAQKNKGKEIKIEVEQKSRFFKE
jgi:hypothetical protein